MTRAIFIMWNNRPYKTVDSQLWRSRLLFQHWRDWGKRIMNLRPDWPTQWVLISRNLQKEVRFLPSNRTIAKFSDDYTSKIFPTSLKKKPLTLKVVMRLIGFFKDSYTLTYTEKRFATQGYDINYLRRKGGFFLFHFQQKINLIYYLLCISPSR